MRIFHLTLNHDRLYYFGLILTAICLPLSKFALSISMIFLIANWLLEGDFKRKFRKLLENKPILIFTVVFFIHILWLINTQNFRYAFHDLGNKAILILYPIIIGTSEKLSINQIKRILIWFSLAVIASTLISTAILVEIIDYPIRSIRDISPFMSHIRLSLLINMSIFSLGYLLFSKRFNKIKAEIILFTIVILWLVIFLFLLKSFTGIIIFFVVLFLVLGFVSLKIRDIVPRLFLQVSLITMFLLVVSFLTHSISKFYTIDVVDFDKLEKYTESGNLYEHYKGLNLIENGRYVWIYVCDEELEKEWNKISDIPFNTKDKKGNKLRTTIARYLTSKELKKDSVGISKLSAQDIANIESGMANHILENKYAIYPKIYQAIWEIDVYRNGNNPTGNSITQRIEFLKAAAGIVKTNFWFGVGTGDVQDSFNKQYEINKSQLSRGKWLRAHNQYITFLLTFGVFGFILLFGAILYPIIEFKAFNNYLFIVFFIIALLSFVNEDTLETQIGVTFFSYFYSVFLFGNRLINKKEEENVQ